MLLCYSWGCKNEAKFAIEMGSVVGRFCPKHIMEILTYGEDLPITIYRSDTPDKEVLSGR
jgi:hypothetical protein